ncbi:MAG: PstS family phosphate ABC transporter substrate-binding protein [Elusimicrobia bacterium]|nr:PstS family phosphate ABC transporter substrate-binding protein [Elusimicrobiota bacterium]
MIKKLLITLFTLTLGVQVYAGSNVVIDGSTTVLPIAQRAAEDFMNAHKDARITVRGGGSGVGITSLLEKTCDIADSSRPIKDAELQKAAGRGISPKAYVIAMDGIAIIVHPENSLANITKQQVEDIYTGKISNWSKLGLKDGKIVIVSRDTASGTFEAFATLALNGKKVRADALMQASNQAIASVVAKTPGSIGYIGHGYLNSAVKAVPVNGISATKQTILSGKYPYSRPLFMYTNGPAQGTAKDLIDFILSKDGQTLVEEEGFVALK